MKNVHFLSAILLLFLISCTNQKTDQESLSDKAQPVPNRNPVKIMVLKPTTFEKELISNGHLMALHKSVLNFGTSGVLTGLYVKNGDKVEKGDVIARLDQEKLKQALQKAQLQVEKAELELRDILLGQGPGYQLEDSAKIPQALFRIAKLRSGYTSAKNDLQDARINLQNSVLRAPFSGVIANLKHKVYEQVSPSDEFCTLIDNAAFEVEFAVLETEMGDVRLNKPVSVTPFADEGRSYNGIVTEINPVVDENGLIMVKALLKNTNGLIEGMNVKVRIETGIPDQLVVPKSAVVLRQNQEVLFKYTNGKAFWTYVQTGYENSTSYTVRAHPDKSGSLAAGDTVIVSGNLNLAHESGVEIR